MSRRKYRHRSPYGRRRKQFRSRKSSGWGMNLYRNTREGKIAGVAAGIERLMGMLLVMMAVQMMLNAWQSLN